MSPRSNRNMHCSVARTLDVLGDKWSLLVIRDAFYGLKRFEEFQRDLGIARNVLTDRLERLVAEGILEREQYEDRPPRFEYVLTRKGKALFPVMMTIEHWGDTWLVPTGDEVPVTWTHTTCGTEDIHAATTCSACGEELRPRHMRPEPVTIQGARLNEDLLATG
ncbi:MAG: helix-turn-helix domain-containing protein [Nitriliruptorales bacterium]|nr:helix-turn-helix domain-containing protein [Nitriliruptorales bacterium]